MRLMLGFAILCICMMLGGIAYRTVSVILPAYLELRDPELLDWISRLQWMPASRNVAATALSSSVFVVGMFGQFLGGVVAERFEPRRGYLIFHLIAILKMYLCHPAFNRADYRLCFNGLYRPFVIKVGGSFLFFGYNNNVFIFFFDFECDLAGLSAAISG